ncbi:MAG: helix-turn-helix domain-containing protein [Micromonosporaceae bacterium]|nr:helix-turn-helix domain-containing protein [Micromonosporaceae bacterium]
MTDPIVGVPARPVHRWSPQQVRHLGVTTDLVTAASVLGIGRTTAYHLARTGQFPVPLRRVGRRYLVAVAHLLHAVGLDIEPGRR